MQQLLTSKEAADMLRIKPRTLMQWRKMGKAPPAHKAGRKLLYDKDELQAWVKKRA